MKFRVEGDIKVHEQTGFPSEVFKLYACHEVEEGDCEGYEPWVFVGTFVDKKAYEKAAEIYKRIKSNGDTFFDVL